MERTYIIPLRRGWLKVPIYKRAKKAVNMTRAFLQKHMKVENVKLGRHLNMALWARGRRSPPHKIEVSVELIKDKEGDYAYAEMVGVQKEALKIVVEEKKKGIASKLEGLTRSKPKVEKKESPNPKAQKQKEEEKKEKEKVLREKPLEKELAKEADEKHVNKENQEKAREDRIVNRDMKEQN